MSASRIKVLVAFLANPLHVQYGFGLTKSTGVKSGTLYPMLEGLEREGWIESYLEMIDEEAVGRPQRRLYRLTGIGSQEARKAVDEFYEDLKGTLDLLPGYQA